MPQKPEKNSRGSTLMSFRALHLSFRAQCLQCSSWTRNGGTTKDLDSLCQPSKLSHLWPNTSGQIIRVLL